MSNGKRTFYQIVVVFPCGEIRTSSPLFVSRMSAIKRLHWYNYSYCQTVILPVYMW